MKTSKAVKSDDNDSCGTPKSGCRKDCCSWCGEKKKVVAKGLCRACYQRQWKKGTLEYDTWTPTECSVEGCDTRAIAKGLCDTHYCRFKRHGHVDDTRPKGWGKREKHPLYFSWNYARRTSSVCDEWLDFWQFVKDVGERPTPEHKLFRVNNSEKLSKDNFEWRGTKIVAVGKNKKEKAADYARKYRMLHNSGKYDVKRRYGLSREDHQDLIDKQNNLCAICGEPETAKKRGSEETRALAIDHCHDRGHVRGLLCSRCNTGIGNFKDSPELMEKAINYLKTT